MRYSSFALAALGFLQAAEGSALKSTGSGLSTPEEVAASVENTVHIQIIDDVTLDKRATTYTTVGLTQSLTGLTKGAKYDVTYKYYAMSLKLSNSCQIRAYFAGDNFGNSAFSNYGLLLKSGSYSGTFTASANKGKLEFDMVCNSAKGRVSLDTATYKLAATTTSTTSKSTSTSITAKTTSTSVAVSSSTTTSSTTTTTAVVRALSTSTSSTQVSSSSTSATSSSASASASTSVPGKATVDTTILIIAPNAYSASSGAAGLLAYGIPYEALIVPKEGVTLPTLNTSSTHGNYGGVIVMDSVSYEYDAGWASAITDAQWTLIHEYQVEFNVRMVRINEFPGTQFGK